MEGGLLKITKHPCHLCSSEALSGTQDRRTNTIIKIVPILLLAQKISSVWEAMSQELWRKSKCIYIRFCHLNDQMYISYKSGYHV